MARRPHTDALAKLSKENFLELRKKVQSPWFNARKKLDLIINRLFPNFWQPLYTMIAHTTIPYREAVLRARRQDQIIHTSGVLLLVICVSSLAFLLQ